MVDLDLAESSLFSSTECQSPSFGASLKGSTCGIHSLAGTSFSAQQQTRAL